MKKKYYAKIIANDYEGLQMISACCTNSIVKVSELKYLSSSKIFLFPIVRKKVEIGQDDKKVNSICKFDLIEKVKSKNINQNNEKQVLKLLAIDYIKNKDDFEINLIFDNNSFIALTAEAIEVRLEDQNEIK
mgnify:CR=1 FL=1